MSHAVELDGANVGNSNEPREFPLTNVVQPKGVAHRVIRLLHVAPLLREDQSVIVIAPAAFEFHL